MIEKRFIRNNSIEEDSIIISDGVIDKATGRILRYDNEYCAFLNYLHKENICNKQLLTVADKIIRQNAPVKIVNEWFKWRIWND